MGSEKIKNIISGEKRLMCTLYYENKMRGFASWRKKGDGKETNE